MKLSNALMNKRTLKCQPYDKTITQIKAAFKRLGLKLLLHKPVKNLKIHSYSCTVDLPDLNVSAYGKGSSKKQAIASALGEITERLSGNFMFKSFYPDYNQIQNKDIIRFDNGEHLSGYVHTHQRNLSDYLPIEDLFRNYHMRYSKDQIANLKQIDISQHWVDGYSLIQDNKIKIPLRLINKINSSNGLASGNTIEEAIVQASCEVFERYSRITIFRNKTIIPTIEKSSINNKIIQKTIKTYENNGIKILLKDFSLKNSIPVIGVVFTNTNIENPDSHNYKYEFIRISNGSSFNLTEAIIRCFTEGIAGMTFKCFKQGFTKKYEQLLAKLNKEFSINTTSYNNLLRKSRYAGDKTFLLEGEQGQMPIFNESVNYLDTISTIKAICNKLGTDFIVVDQTHPTLNFPTVRVIMPSISEVLNYYSYDYETLINILMYGNLENTSVQKYNAGYKITTEKNLRSLENQILRSYLENGDYSLCNISNELNSAKNGMILLSSIYYKRTELDEFATIAELISKENKGKLGRIYRYLQLLTRYFLKTQDKEILSTIKNTYQNMLGCHKYLSTTPSQNPHISWCDQPCEKECEKKYRLALSKVIKSFFS